MLAVITGASRGIGESYARLLAARGYDLVLVARDAERLQRVAETVRAGHRVAAECLVLDLALRDAAERLHAEMSRRGAAVDLLVNNAGFGLYGDFLAQPMARIEDMVHLHILTLVKTVRLFLPDMLARRRGAIINVASTAGLHPLPYLALYAATKAFMVSFGQAIAMEARPYGVLIQTCCPGQTTTEFHRTAGVKPHRTPGGSQTADEVVAESLAALDRQRRLVVTGWRNKVLAHAQRFVPAQIILSAAARILKPSKG
jgi:short-subunit dehydrogenase